MVVGRLETIDVTRFEQMILPHLDAAYTLARYLTRDRDDADDVVQEAAFRAIRYFHTLRKDDPREVRSWLFSIVRRVCMTTYADRRHAATTSVSLDEPTLQLVDPREAPDAATEHALVRERVQAAVDRLPDVLREVVVLREVEQCSYQEIASITGVPIGTVMSRISRARARLAAMLRGMIETGDVQ